MKKYKKSLKSVFEEVCVQASKQDLIKNKSTDCTKTKIRLGYVIQVKLIIIFEPDKIDNTVGSENRKHSLNLGSFKILILLSEFL